MTTRRSLIIAALASASIATAACGTTTTTTTQQHQASVPAWVAAAAPLQPYPAFATVLGLDRTFGQINQALAHVAREVR